MTDLETFCSHGRHVLQRTDVCLVALVQVFHSLLAIAPAQ